MNDETGIANFALLALGSDSQIQNLETDTDKAARVLRLLYWTTLKGLIGSYAWNWATVYQKLTLLSIYPTPEWPFQYAYPANCLKMVRIWNHSHLDDVTTSIKFLKSNNGIQTTILTEYGPPSIIAGQNKWAPTQPTLPLSGTTWPIPVAQFVAYTTNVRLMPEMFKQAFGFFLAAYAAPSLPGIGQTNLRNENLQLGNAALAQALAQDLNESRPYAEQKSMIEKAGSGQWLAVSGNFEAFPNNYPT